MTDSFILISLDGLSPREFKSLLERMPHAKALFKTVSEVDSAPFSAPQPIWAELLTGKAWFENGCAAYSRPDKSLNKLHVFTEKDLLTPVSLVDNDDSVIVCNVPILIPAKRMWISDGSMPTAQSISPAKLSQYFGSYKPRVYSNLAVGLENRFDNALANIQKETQRLEGVSKVLRAESWSRAIVRLTVFDQLHHLYGMSPLHESGLAFEPDLNSFIKTLDDFIYEFSKNSILAIFSGYSHVACKARISINAMLAREGLLNVYDEQHSDSRLSSRRVDAFEALSGIPVSSAVLHSVEGRFAEKDTVAAALMYGCVYLNTTQKFQHGTVSDTAYANTLQSVKSALLRRLVATFGHHATIHQNLNRSVASLIPDLIVSVYGAEYFDSPTRSIDSVDVPKSCHAPVGFFTSTAADGTDEHSTTKKTPIAVHRELLRLGTHALQNN